LGEHCPNGRPLLPLGVSRSLSRSEAPETQPGGALEPPSVDTQSDEGLRSPLNLMISHRPPDLFADLFFSVDFALRLFPAEYELRNPRMVIVLCWCGDYKNIPRADGRSPVIDSYTPIESEHLAHAPTFSFRPVQFFLNFLFLFPTRVDCFATMSLGRTDQSAPRQNTGDAPTVRIGSCDCELKKRATAAIAS